MDKDIEMLLDLRIPSNGGNESAAQDKTDFFIVSELRPRTALSAWDHELRGVRGCKSPSMKFLCLTGEPNRVISVRLRPTLTNLRKRVSYELSSNSETRHQSSCAHWKERNDVFFYPTSSTYTFNSLSIERPCLAQSDYERAFLPLP